MAHLVTAERAADQQAVQALVVAAFSFSLMSLFARLVGGRIPAFEIVFFRSLVTLVLTWLMLRRRRLGDATGQRRGLLLLRGAFGLAALACFFYSVTHLPLAEATVIQFTSPILTALVAAIVLREPTTRRVGIAIGLGLAGVLLITRPGGLLIAAYPALATGTILIGLAGAFFTSCAQVAVRRLTATEHELVIVLYFPLVGVPASLAVAAPTWVWPTAVDALLLLAVGFAGQAGQVLLTRGLKRLTAAGASVILYLQILFATLWGLLVLGEQPSWWTLGGSVSILAGTLLAARRPRLPG